MATSEENDLIGYDPLAWMEGNIDKNEDTIDSGSSDNDIKLEEQHLIDEEIRMTGANDHSDDLIANAEESAVLSVLSNAEGNITKEDEIGIEEIPVEIDIVVTEETVDMSDCAIAGDLASDESAGSQIDLDATLTIQNVVKLHEKLKNSFAIHDQIEINASDVSSIDTATLQLLVSLKKEAVKLQKQVTIIYPSPRFVESAQLLGLVDVLDVHDA
ncbi:MAG: STAS domain-containing protein [Methylobacter sp.]|nr:STAS domain-containing protein [Methylobacter sp.]